MIPDNAWTLRITAAAGTELAGPYSYSTVSHLHVGGFFLYKSSLQPIGPSSCTRHGWFRVAPIAQYSSLLPPVGVWSVSQYQCGDLPLRTPNHRRLGEPLPRLLANDTHGHLYPKSLIILSMPLKDTMGY